MWMSGGEAATYLDLPTGDRDTNPRQAIKCYWLARRCTTPPDCRRRLSSTLQWRFSSPSLSRLFARRYISRSHCAKASPEIERWQVYISTRSRQAYVDSPKVVPTSSSNPLLGTPWLIFGGKGYCKREPTFQPSTNRPLTLNNCFNRDNSLPASDLVA